MKLMEDYIKEECFQISEMLTEKNASYGNSAAEPLNLFSPLSSIEQLNVRIDDKLSRIKHGAVYGHEDTELDLIGYLILKRAVQKRNEALCEG